MILFDKMDDLFESNLLSLFGGRSSSSSKVFGNRLPENNPVPMIWTINDTHLLDPANLRRMAFALEVETQPQKARVNVWKKILDKHDCAAGIVCAFSVLSFKDKTVGPGRQPGHFLAKPQESNIKNGLRCAGHFLHGVVGM